MVLKWSVDGGYVGKSVQSQLIPALLQLPEKGEHPRGAIMEPDVNDSTEAETHDTRESGRASVECIETRAGKDPEADSPQCDADS